MKKRQLRVTLKGKELSEKENELDRLLKEGWTVVHECSFSESVSVNYGGRNDLWNVKLCERGEYGIVFILEEP